MEKFFAESAIMLDFEHPNILCPIGVCFNTEDNLPAIVLPYMAKKDLRNFLRDKRETFCTVTSSKRSKKYPEVSRNILVTINYIIVQHA